MITVGGILRKIFLCGLNQGRAYSFIWGGGRGRECDLGVLMLACMVVHWFLTGTSGHYCHTSNTSKLCSNLSSLWLGTRRCWCNLGTWTHTCKRSQTGISKFPLYLLISCVLTCALFNCFQTLSHSMEEGLLKSMVLTTWYEQESTLLSYWQEDRKLWKTPAPNALLIICSNN